jgi:hypothetical protein
MPDAIRVNGNQLSWGSIRLIVDGENFTGFSSIVYGDKRERVKAFGMGRHHAARGRSAGKYTTEPVKLTGWRSSTELLRRSLALRSPDQISYGSVEFMIVVLYSEMFEPNIDVQITGCVLVGQTVSDEESPDPLKEELEIDCMAIRRNGLTLFDSMEIPVPV